MSVINSLISAGRAFSEWRRRERAYAELMSLDDHSLADIGIHRSQIGGLAGDVRQSWPSASPVAFPNQGKFAQQREA